MPPTMPTERLSAFDSIWFEFLKSTEMKVLERLPVNGLALSVVVNGAGVLMLIQVPLSTYCWQ